MTATATKLEIGQKIHLTVPMVASMVKCDINDREAVEKELKQKGLEYGQFEAIVSNSGRDRHGEVIRAEGIDLKAMKKNGPLMWAHNYDQLPLGRVVKVWKSQGQVMAKAEIDWDIHEFAHTVYKQILRGTLRAVSIGGIVKEFDEKDFSVIKELEMVELSVVPIGAHPDALISAKDLGMKKSELRKQYQRFIFDHYKEKFAEVDVDEIDNSIKAMETVLAALKATHKEASAVDATTKRVKYVTLKQQASEVDRHAETLNKVVKLKLKEVSNE